MFSGRDADGKPTQVSQTVHGTKPEAQRVAAGFESSPHSTAAGRTVADVLGLWRETNDGVWAESSKRDYAGRATAIADDPIGRMAVARLGVSDVERWHTRMRRSGVGPTTIRSRHSALRAALARAERWGWVTSNVARLATLRSGKVARRESMSSDDVRTVIEAAQALDAAAGLALRLAAVAGLRRAELAALQWTDFDIETGQLTVDSSITVRGSEDGSVLVDSVTKTADRRVLRLDVETMAQIATLRAERECVNSYLFSISPGPPNPDRIGWWWRCAREASGIDLKWRLHDLRHWTATTAITRGHDVRTVAGRLGHANPAMTLRVYAHALDSADVQLAESLGAVLDAAGVCYSTLELLEIEDRLLDQADGDRHTEIGIARYPLTLPEAEHRYSRDQRRMVEAITSDGAGVSVLIGAAGSSKTFALAAARAAWERDGYTSSVVRSLPAPRNNSKPTRSPRCSITRPVAATTVPELPARPSVLRCSTRLPKARERSISVAPPPPPRWCLTSSTASGHNSARNTPVTEPTASPVWRRRR